MVYINKVSNPPIKVTDSTSNESPVREAVRSMELEQLIASTNQIIEKSMIAKNSANVSPIERCESAIAVAELPQNNEQLSTEKIASSSAIPTKMASLTNTSILRKQTNVAQEKKEQCSMLHTEEQSSSTLNNTEPLNKSNTISFEGGADNVINVSDDEEMVNVPIDETSAKSVNVPADTSETTNIEQNQKNTENTINRYPLKVLYKCAKCKKIFKAASGLKRHCLFCYPGKAPIHCAFCSYTTEKKYQITDHYVREHGPLYVYYCTSCKLTFNTIKEIEIHMSNEHSKYNYNVASVSDSYWMKYNYFITTQKNANENVNYKPGPKRRRSTIELATPAKTKRYGPGDIDTIPINPILDEYVYCSECEFFTKVRVNMVRHLQQHANQMPVANTAPVNPVPHLETNEKHFDKMTNLAASSNVTRTEKTNNTTAIIINKCVSSDSAANYPRYVPERKRHACGAVGCSYISVNEVMLKCHWETLHSNTQEFKCVHCPAEQQLDTSRPLTASRVLTHLKMHDAKLYSCSMCSYYHYQIQFIKKHIVDKHASEGKVIVIREPAVTTPSQPVPTAVSSASAPTMDLKAWQCGLCQFKSMLRPEIMEHCSIEHHSKFQFKCAFCQWRTSTYDSVIKHHSTTHPGKSGEVFYFYYREGSLADAADGTPRWMAQSKSRQISANSAESNKNTSSTLTSVDPVDLKLVKTEIPEDAQIELTLPYLKGKFGPFCEPNGKKYVCPLCNVTTEDSKDKMESHLYEELNYRK